MSPTLILYIFALVFMVLAALRVPSAPPPAAPRIDWMCASFACLIGTLLTGH